MPTPIGKSVTVAVRDEPVVCRELTVAQVRELLERNEYIDIVDEGLIDGLRIQDISLFTGKTLEWLNSLLLSEIEEIVAACQGANPGFFRLMAKVAKAASRA